MNVLKLVFLMLLAAGAFWLTSCSGKAASAGAVQYTCPMHPSYVSDKPGKCPICGMDLVPVKKTKEPAPGRIRYRSTMNPDEVADKPGKDSMGMEMVPFESGETVAKPVQGLVPVTISPEQQKLIGVKTEKITVRKLAKKIVSQGSVAYDPDLYGLEQEFIAASKTYGEVKDSGMKDAVDNARTVLDSAKFKLRQQGFSDGAIAELAAKGAPDASLLSSANSSTAWVYAPLFEFEMENVSPGQAARIYVQSDPRSRMKGTIISVDPVVNQETRSVRVRIRAENPEGRLKPGMYVTAEILVPLGERPAVPDSAVIDTGTRKVVFVSGGNGTFEPRDVVLGEKAGGYYSVRTGIMPGENVVTQANFLIDSESRLQNGR